MLSLKGMFGLTDEHTGIPAGRRETRAIFSYLGSRSIQEHVIKIQRQIKIEERHGPAQEVCSTPCFLKNRGNLLLLFYWEVRIKQSRGDRLNDVFHVHFICQIMMSEHSTINTNNTFRPIYIKNYWSRGIANTPSMSCPGRWFTYTHASWLDEWKQHCCPKMSEYPAEENFSISILDISCRTPYNT